MLEPIVLYADAGVRRSKAPAESRLECLQDLEPRTLDHVDREFPDRELLAVEPEKRVVGPGRTATAGPIAAAGRPMGGLAGPGGGLLNSGEDMQAGSAF